MFSREELLAWIDKLQSHASVRKWPQFYTSPDIEYEQAQGEESIILCSGFLELHQSIGVIQIDPILCWMHSAMWLSFMARGLRHSPEFLEMWDDPEEQDRIIDYRMRPALCRPVLVSRFYEIYNGITEGRLPRALETYEPVSEVMCMHDDWNMKVYMARNARRYITFSWSTSA
jgi:hypothetical protein